MLSNMFNLVVLAAAGLQSLYHQATNSRDFKRDVKQNTTEDYGYNLDQPQFTLYERYSEFINSEDYKTSYCPDFNIIELLGNDQGPIYETCKSPTFVTPETWSTVTSTRIANFKAALSIGQVYSNSVFGIQFLPTGPTFTPNRAPLHMVALYTRHISDECVNRDWPPAPTITTAAPTKTVESTVFEKVDGSLASFIRRFLISLPTQIVSDVGTHVRIEITICFEAYIRVAAVLFTILLFTGTLTHSCVVCDIHRFYVYILTCVKLDVFDGIPIMTLLTFILKAQASEGASQVATFKALIIVYTNRLQEHLSFLCGSFQNVACRAASEVVKVHHGIAESQVRLENFPLVNHAQEIIGFGVSRG